MTQTSKARKKKTPKVVLGVMIPVEHKHEVEALAQVNDWSDSKAGAYLIKLGIEKLRESQNGIRSNAHVG